MSIKLIILDVDGVMTDGSKTYDTKGKVISKQFNDRDFTAIKIFKSLGIRVVFLSGDPFNEKIAKNRNIPFFCSRVNGVMVRKEEFVSQFEVMYGVHRDDMVYVGDDVFDIGIMKEVGYPFCPSDSPKGVKEYCVVLKAKSGENCLTELYEMLYDRNLIGEYSLEEVEQLDKNEKF
jgi:3-deoxy-D-manno-octulosonate 8-phosphate phosphatase (KDO 8-P phosphatase)